jgi:hypothetical protein
MPGRDTLLLGEGDRFDLPGNIKKDMSSFTEVVKSNLPDKGLFKEMGVSNIDIEKLFTQLAQNF